MSGGSKKETSQSTQTSSNTINPAQMAMLQGNYGNAQANAAKLAAPYTGTFVAPFSATQQQGQRGLLDIASNNIGGDTLSQAKASTAGVLGYTPGSLATTDLKPYMNPYTDNVVDASLSDLQRARERQQVADNQAATAAGAFGGSRQAVRDSLTTDDYLRNVAATSAGLRSAAFSNAQDAASRDINTGLTGQQLKLSASQQLQGMSDQELQQAIQRAGLVQGVGEQQTAHDQANLDAQYQEFLRQLQGIQTGQNLTNASLGLIPVQQTINSSGNGTTVQKTNPGLLGSIGQGLGIAGSLLAL